jgi:NAD(P)-dependent dehydrogenase (short-subunit alcohol dehydrogenase family)
MNFFRKLAVVVGGSGGIGRSIVEAFAAAGAEIAFLDQEEETGCRLADALGPDCLFMPGDVSRADVLSEFAERVVSRFGRVDYLVNAVRAEGKGILSGCGHTEFSRILQVGAVAPYQLVHLFLGAFSRNAAVVNITVPGASSSHEDRESAAAEGGALRALTRSLAVSLAGRVRVNLVVSGWTDMSFPADAPQETGKASSPAGRAPKADDVVALVLFLCGPGASCLTGQEIAVGGGIPL